PPEGSASRRHDRHTIEQLFTHEGIRDLRLNLDGLGFCFAPEIIELDPDADEDKQTYDDQDHRERAAPAPGRRVGRRRCCRLCPRLNRGDHQQRQGREKRLKSFGSHVGTSLQKGCPNDLASDRPDYEAAETPLCKASAWASRRRNPGAW